MDDALFGDVSEERLAVLRDATLHWSLEKWTQELWFTSQHTLMSLHEVTHLPVVRAIVPPHYWKAIHEVAVEQEGDEQMQAIVDHLTEAIYEYASAVN